MAAILGPGGPSTATYFATGGPGVGLFWEDHLWHNRPCQFQPAVNLDCGN